MIPRASRNIRLRALCLMASSVGMAIFATLALAESSFEKGNTAFEAGDYAEAVKAYEASIQEGVSGANVYFNLGNANLRAGEKGRAVLNYQRALALRPGHPEAIANLAYVQRSLNLPAAPATAWSQFVEWMGVDAVAIVAAIGAWVVLAGLVALLGPWPQPALGWSLVMTGGAPLIAGLFLLYGLRGGARDPGRAIVVSDNGTKAHYAPADNSREVQVLPAGTEIRLLQDRGSWIYVEVAGGLRGWVAAGNVDTVLPREPAAPGS
jgi:Tetratricopeptide repeat/Bacterial SH3 domain